jgi:hypothetical protein
MIRMVENLFLEMHPMCPQNANWTAKVVRGGGHTV